MIELGFVTIRIFARTELKTKQEAEVVGFVTIRIFARTELRESAPAAKERFVTIRIFAGTDLKNEKGNDTRQKGQRDTPTHILLCKC